MARVFKCDRCESIQKGKDPEPIGYYMGTYPGAKIEFRPEEFVSRARSGAPIVPYSKELCIDCTLELDKWMHAVPPKTAPG